MSNRMRFPAVFTSIWAALQGSFARAIAPAFAMLALASCVSEPLPDGNAAYAVETGLQYTLGPGDKIRVTVFGETALSGEFMVASNGAVAIPLVGNVSAGGLTPTQFQTAVHDKLSETGLVIAPRVSADVVEYRPFYILGEVNNPGRYPYSIGMTVTKAVATAGGFTYRANEKVIFVTREGETHETPLALTAAAWIAPGDTVRVGERNF